jgi:bacillithiol system protein YtxJ
MINIFSKRKTSQTIPMDKWKSITREQDVRDIVTRSNETAQIIFKDSVTCGISAFAKSRIVDGYDEIDGKADFNYLDLLAYRPISNFIAEHLHVNHQSPQIIILKNGEVVHSVTHHAITAKGIAEKL